MSGRQAKGKDLDLSPENCKRIEALLTEASDVMAICRDVGVDCDEQCKKIESLRTLYKKILEIHKRERKV